MFEYIAGGLAIAGFTTGAFYFAKDRANKREIFRLSATIANQTLEIDEFEKERDKFLQSNAQLESTVEHNRSVIDQIKTDILEVTNEKELAEETRTQAEIRESVLKERLLNLEKNLKNWQEDKETHIESAKAFVAEATTKLTNDLLDKHKKETKTAKEEQEKQIQKTTQDLQKQFQQVFESMSVLNENINTSKQTVDLVKNALLTPGGAGSLSEITLENIFIASGLVEGVDYFTQHWISATEGTGLKPDAVVMLPKNSYIIIDSKASKFYIDIENNYSEEESKKEFEKNLKNSMNNHLKALKIRNYKKAIEDKVNDDENENDIGYVEVLMFLPTDTAVEKLRRIDPKFMEKAWKERILPVGPSGLLSHLLMANMKIQDFKQFENSQKIINEVKNLISSVATLNDHSQKIGKGIKSAFDNYDKFAASFNQNFLSKTKKLEKLGVTLPTGKSIKQLDRYQITASNEIIEVEAVDEEEPQLLTQD